MRGVAFVRLCQRMVSLAKRNHWKLEKFPLSGDILDLSSKLELPPTMIARALLSKKGLSRVDINKALSGNLGMDPLLEALINRANGNDPVFSPKGIEYSKWRGDTAEKILALWLDSLGREYERDLGRGIPDFLLKKSMNVAGRDVNWIESKASFGDPRTRKNDEPQFKRFDEYGPGAVIYWYGLEGPSHRMVITYMDILNVLPLPLQEETRSFLDYVPPEFKHLV